MKLTDEQAAAVAAQSTGQPLRVIAYAGAGKTATLVAMARQLHVRGLYVAFNKAIAIEAAGKFAHTPVECRTAHSLAYRHVRGLGYSDDRMRTTMSSRMLRNIRVDGIGDRVAIQLIVGTLRRFCQSADALPAPHHVPRPVKIDSDTTWKLQRAALAKHAAATWQRMSSAAGDLPLGHDGYLKVWALTNPRLDASYGCIMVDEAQDLNPVLVGVLTNQQCQVVSVGDPHQQIYAWRGAVDALQQLPGVEARLTQSFRFGPRIAEHASRLLAAMGESIPVRGMPGITDVVSDPDWQTNAVLHRTNAGVVETIAERLACGETVHVPGGVQELIALVEDAQRLRRNEPAIGAELLGFATWREVQEFAESEEGGSLRVLVSLVDNHGCGELLQLLSQVTQSPMLNGCTVCTAHKSKGLEWPEVELGADFARSEPSLEERRLFYVASTRAKRELAVPAQLADAFMKDMCDVGR
jgi:superfamily I DNA/RNA helicase